MRKRLPALLLVAICCTATGEICQACLNDAELPQHEREFRSQYEGRPPMLTRNKPVAPNLTMMSAGGWLLLAGSTALALVKRKVRTEAGTE
ncbi:MAG: hypothetical protein R3C19_18640 [Planctomycetaceae bacterium]